MTKNLRKVEGLFVESLETDVEATLGGMVRAHRETLEGSGPD
jgi:hypothetical protein